MLHSAQIDSDSDCALHNSIRQVFVEWLRMVQQVVENGTNLVHATVTMHFRGPVQRKFRHAPKL